MNLTNQTIETTYGNVLTIGTAAGAPTGGTIQNGAGVNLTSLTVSGTLNTDVVNVSTEAFVEELDVNTTATINTVQATTVNAVNADIETLTVDNIVYAQSSVDANGVNLNDATQLSGGLVLVDSPSANDIAVKLPSPVLGTSVKIINTSTRDIEVYPNSSTDSVLGLPAGDAYIVSPDGLMYEFVCVQNPNVGVWSVVSPYNGTSAVINYTLDLVVGSGIGTSVSGGSGGVSATVDQIYDPNGALIHQEFVLGNNGNMPIIDMSKFAGYGEMRMKKLVMKTNVPTGDFSSAPSSGSLSYDEMGLSLNQFNTLKVFMSSAIWDFSITNTVQTYSVSDIGGKAWDPTYNMNYWMYLNGNSNFNPALSNRGGYTHYVATPSDLAYDSSNPSARYQKYELVFPDVVSGYANWQPIYDNNGNPARYIGFDATYSSQSEPASGFPSGFEFKVSISIDWELR